MALQTVSRNRFLVESDLILSPAAVVTLVSAGVARVKTGDLHSGLRLIKRAVRLDRVNALAQENLGVALLECHRAEEAVDCFQRAVILACDRASIYLNLATAYHNQNKSALALSAYLRSVELGVFRAEVFNALGVIFDGLKQFFQSNRLFGKAIALSPSKGDYLSNYSDGGGSNLSESARVSWGQRAIECDPRNPTVLFNFACLLGKFRKISLANKVLDQVLTIVPDHADARFNRSLNLLLLGRLPEAWVDYEWRWKTTVALSSGLPPMEFDPVRPDDLRNQELALIHEQGLGDFFQFCRYGRLAAELGAQVIMYVPPSLLRLVSAQSWITAAFESDRALPRSGRRVPIMSMPHIFRTSLESIPFGSEAYLHAPSADVERWRELLASQSPPSQLRVGVVWNGGFRPDRPDLWQVNERRNISLPVFSAGLDMEGIAFVILQKGDPAESNIRGAETKYWKSGSVFNAAPWLNDFSDTASLIANLDLVISVDTSVAHLSAALGKPTWILNRYDSCWRWLLAREDSPWYASVKLYRQAVDRDWVSVLARVRSDLSMLRNHRVVETGGAFIK